MFPLIILTLLLGLNCIFLGISSIIFIIFIILIDFLSLIYLAFNIYNNISLISKNISNSNFVNYNNEFSNLMFKYFIKETLFRQQLFIPIQIILQFSTRLITISRIDLSTFFNNIL